MMAQAILVATLAGVASALLSGVFSPGSMWLVMLVMMAPLPLFIAGFGCHSLVAALGGLIAAFAIDLALGDRAALVFVGTIAAPTYGILYLAERMFSVPGAASQHNDVEDGLNTGRIALIAVFYIAILVIGSAIWAEPDYAAFTARLRQLVAQTAGVMLGPDRASLPPGVEERIITLMSDLMVPISALVILSTLVISSTLGVQIAERAGLMTYHRPDFRRFRLPGGALILLAITAFAMTRDGYVGAFAEIIALGLALMLMLQGLAVVHMRTLGSSARTMILTAMWAALIVFGVPALILIGIGMADHLLNLRHKKT